jgi:hypothetical protein
MCENTRKQPTWVDYDFLRKQTQLHSVLKMLQKVLMSLDSKKLQG